MASTTPVWGRPRRRWNVRIVYHVPVEYVPVTPPGRFKPKRTNASCTARALAPVAPVLKSVQPPENSPSARAVVSSITPVTGRPFWRWKFLTEYRMYVENTPLAPPCTKMLLRISACWAAATPVPAIPSRRSIHAAAGLNPAAVQQAERPGRVQVDHSGRGQAVGALVLQHRQVRVRRRTRRLPRC